MSVGRLMGRLNPRQLMSLAFRLRPNSEFILFQGQRLTRGQAYDRMKSLAAGLQRLGIGKGDRVASLLPACPEAVYTLFMPWVLGNVNVPLNPLLGEHELRHILADSGAKVVIIAENWYGQNHASTLERLLPELPDLRYVVVRDATEGNGTTLLPMKDVVAGERALRPVEISPHDTMTLAYTSGTTGLPKGVVHTRSRALGIAVGPARLRMKLRALRCMLLPYPPYHTAGRFGLFISLFAGGKVILMDRLNPRQMLEHIEREKVTQIAGSPTMYRMLMGTSGQEKYDLSSVRRIAFSSESLDMDTARALHDRFGCHLENMYGTTESMMISWTDLDDPWKRVASTVGKPVPGARVRIVDDDREPLPIGERGEIAVQTSQMMIGYHRAPELTAEVLDPEGWFYTGDIGYLDDSGYLRLVDRKKDVIIRGGQNVYPAEVEAYLQRHPLIRRAGVIGVPSDLGGEVVWAYVEAQAGAALATREVLGFCLGQIAPFKIPAQVRFVDRLPTTAAGKVQRFKLREMAAQELGAQVAAALGT